MQGLKFRFSRKSKQDPATLNADAVAPQPKEQREKEAGAKQVVFTFKG